MSVGSAAAITIERIIVPVERMHRAISQRWFSAVGLPGKPVEAAHNGVAKTVYSSIRLAASLGGLAADHLIRVPPATADRTKAVVNGLWGDKLGQHAARLEVPMGLRDRSSEPVAFEHIADAYPDPGPNLVFLVHGFADTERCWLATATRPGMYEVLDESSGFTPILVRYNTGMSLAVNGALLARLIEDLTSAWPVPVQTAAAVGHSMGGLVMRSACAEGQNDGHSWVSKMSSLTTIGSPHLGTPIEKLVNVLAASLGISRNTVPLQEFTDTRSDGIKDLRWGLAGHPLSPGVAHHFVAGVVTSRAQHPVGAALGDLVVRVHSATAGSEAETSSEVVVGRSRHNDLVHSDEVISQVVAWLGA
ncbi:MAG: hypothetical protein QNJ75_00590 [Acidimicrobiia bacterium]|nr:hypothetical protein [Acidimicrobiia bacterium]